ncbi:MAG: response regulator [Bacteroidetes bacterium]|nr:response regulator [Bacteroidota bacterium]
MSPLSNIDPNKLFPFYFIIDKSLCIIDAGKGLLKLYPAIINDQFPNQFKFERPFSILPEFNSILEYSQQIFILKSTKEEKLMFRGQAICMATEEKVIFLISPWITNVDELKKHNLLLTDFALHDTITDMLQILRSNEIAMNDINELVDTLKYSEGQIKLNEEKFRSIIENMGLGLLEINNDDVIIYPNERFCKMTGHMREDLIGKNTLDAIFTGNKYKSKISLQNIKKMLGQENVFEIQMRKKGGEIMWALISEAPLYDIKQNIIGSIGIYLDITERKNYEQELRSAKELAENSKKVKEQFLANMSHEIRTPMNAIIGMAKILEENNLNEEQKECITVINLSADNLLSIINDILDFSKIESGKITFEKHPFKLRKVIEGIIQTLHFTVNSKSIILNYSISDNVPPVIIGDIVRLRQILLNLCSNSIKFTEQGTVSIDVQLKEQRDNDYTLLFTVTDTGIGIPADKLPTIFESFVQASGDTTRKYGGTGLGLTITKQLIELQGGCISVKSKINEGSQFSFTITFTKGEEDQLELGENEKEFAFTGLEGINVLLAEDNPMNQILAKKIFNKWNLKYDIAENGKIAIEKLAQTDYDIILMDMHMPEMDGYETVKYIRKQLSPPKSLIPIIAVTANAIIGEEEKCLATGMNDYISKPLNNKKLYQKMLKLLRKDPVSEPQQVTLELEPKINTESVKCVDLTYLKQIAEGSREFMIEMINSFIADTPKTLSDMDSAFAGKRWPELKIIAHTMKSSVDFMGIHSIREVVRNIEKFAEKRTNLESLPDLIETTKFTCIKALEELKVEIKRLS